MLLQKLFQLILVLHTTVSTKSETINLHSHHKLHGFLRAPFHYFSFTTVVSVMYAEKIFMVYCSVPKISSVNVVHFVFQQTRFAKKYWKNKIEGIPVLKIRAMVKRSIKIFQKIVKKMHQKNRQEKIVKINSSKNS